MQVQHVYESYFLLEKNPALSDVRRYVFDSLLEHFITRDNTFAQMILCGKDVYTIEKSTKLFDDIRRVFDEPKLIRITIAKDIFTVLYYMIFDCCESGCYMVR